METGIVKWFNNSKGFGFICHPESGEDIFAHYSMIQMEGYRTLKAGQQVRFTRQQGPKGQHAIQIEPAAARIRTEGITPEITATHLRGVELPLKPA